MAWVAFVPIFWPITIPIFLIEKVSDYFYNRRMDAERHVRQEMEDLDEGRRRACMQEHQAYCRSVGLTCSDEDADAYLASGNGKVTPYEGPRPCEVELMWNLKGNI
jgi:hypothetical protein